MEERIEGYRRGAGDEAHAVPGGALRRYEDGHPLLADWTAGDMAKAVAAVIGLSVLVNFIAVVVADAIILAGQEYEDNATA
jgi:hypothetical protein